MFVIDGTKKFDLKFGHKFKLYYINQKKIEVIVLFYVLEYEFKFFYFVAHLKMYVWSVGAKISSIFQAILDNT